MDKEYFGGLNKGDLLYYKNGEQEDVGTVLNVEWNEACLYDMKVTVQFSKLYNGSCIQVFAHSSMKECDCFRVKQ